MIELKPLLPYIKLTNEFGSFNRMVFAIDITGVIPLPAAISKYEFELEGFGSKVKCPVGVITSSSIFSFNDSNAQLEKSPFSTFLIATLSSFSEGDLQIE
jgi:hypothetical protein